jgi:hypothetical protein
LSGLARLETDAKHGPLVLTTDTYEAVAERAPVPDSYAGYADRLVQELARRSKYPGLPTNPENIEPLAARMFLPVSACDGLLSQLQAAGFLQVVNGDQLRLRVQLSQKGWTRVDELQAKRALSHRVFVAMWFDRGLRPAYEDGIRRALTDCGDDPPFRVDDREHDGKADTAEFQPRIDDRVLGEIRRARFVVADVSGGRPAVYFEAGLAMGLGIPVLWTCRAGTMSTDMCFDTRQFEHILWETPSQLSEALRERIRARNWQRHTT